MPETFLHELIQKGSIVSICLFAIWIISKKLFQATDDRAEDFKKQIDDINQRSISCEKDRRDMALRQDKMQDLLVKEILEKK